MLGKSKKNAEIESKLIPTSVAEELKKNRYMDQVAGLKADRNRWAIGAFFLLVLLLFTVYAWKTADDRFSNNVRVAWVKLHPSGRSEVDFSDEGKQIDFFQTTVDSALTDFVEKRFSQRPETIRLNYQIAAIFLSSALRMQFINEENAVKVARDVEQCPNCGTTEIKVRTIQHQEKIAIVLPKKPKENVYHSLIFVTEIKRSKEGVLQSKRNLIISLVWALRTKEEIMERRAELRYNPLGMEIDEVSVRIDPTPVAEEEGN